MAGRGERVEGDDRRSRNNGNAATWCNPTPTSCPFLENLVLLPSPLTDFSPRRFGLALICIRSCLPTYLRTPDCPPCLATIDQAPPSLVFTPVTQQGHPFRGHRRLRLVPLTRAASFIDDIVPRTWRTRTWGDSGDEERRVVMNKGMDGATRLCVTVQEETGEIGGRLEGSQFFFLALSESGRESKK